MRSYPTPTQSQSMHRLADGELHVWQASLRQNSAFEHQFFQCLSDEELARANQLRFDKDRSTFIIGRGILRHLLATYLSIEPSAVEFAYNEFGKPILKSDVDALHFNLSHARDIAVYALAYGRQVGVDIEYVHRIPELEQIARRFFSANEARLLEGLPAAQRLAAFFNCWTRKEAYIKAKGEGLSMPLSQFDVSFLPDEPPVLLSTRGDPHEASRWDMISFWTESNYIVALAVERPLSRVFIRWWDYTSSIFTYPTGS